ncbi:hypothetical protein ACROYT_G014140 [Oculina patagonica]
MLCEKPKVELAGELLSMAYAPPGAMGLSNLTTAAWPLNIRLQIGNVTTPSICHDLAKDMPPKPGLELHYIT